MVGLLIFAMLVTVAGAVWIAPKKTIVDKDYDPNGSAPSLFSLWYSW